VVTFAQWNEEIPREEYQTYNNEPGLTNELDAHMNPISDVMPQQYEYVEIFDIRPSPFPAYQMPAYEPALQPNE